MSLKKGVRLAHQADLKDLNLLNQRLHERDQPKMLEQFEEYRVSYKIRDINNDIKNTS